MPGRDFHPQDQPTYSRRTVAGYPRSENRATRAIIAAWPRAGSALVRRRAPGDLLGGDVLDVGADPPLVAAGVGDAAAPVASGVAGAMGGAATRQAKAFEDRPDRLPRMDCGEELIRPWHSGHSRKSTAQTGCISFAQE